MSEPTPKYIASCSFGKDSVAAILTRLAHSEPVDEAVYCRIMFDDNTSAELPEHEQWIHETAIPLLESRYGIKTTVVQANKTYVEQFFATYKRGAKVGRIYGFPFRRGPWCNAMLKIRPLNALQSNRGGQSIVGIAADELKRIDRALAKGQILPLVEHNVTEAQAFDIAKKANLLSPAYSKGRERLGCWFCHNQRIAELRGLRTEHLALWTKLLALDSVSPCRFTTRHTVADLDARFAAEDDQLQLIREGYDAKCLKQ